MFPVTQKFQEEIRNTRGRKVYGRLEIDYTDVFLDESINVDVSESANVSYPQQTADNINVPYGKILSLDGSCRLDGTYVLAPTEEESYMRQMGWWGNQLSDVNGNFINPYPTLSINFNSRPLTKLTVIGDASRREYPVDFNIYAYGENDTLIYTENIVNNDVVNWNKELNNPVTGITKLSLEILKWNLPNRQVKITEFYTSIKGIYEDDDIVSMKIIEQRNDSSYGIPIGAVANNEIEIQLDNKNGRFTTDNKQSPLYQMLKPNRRIKSFLGVMVDGGIEYVPTGVFWTDDWNIPSNQPMVSTIGRDRLKFLEEDSYTTNSPLLNISLYDLAEIILIDSGLSNEHFFIDPVLENYVIPVVYYEDVSYRDILSQIAESCLGQVYCDRLGVIRVEGNEPTSERRTVITNENSNISYPEQLVDGVEEPSDLYLSLDGNSTLDGSYKLAPTTIDEGQFGWWGEQLSSEDFQYFISPSQPVDSGGFFKEPFPKAIVTFQETSVSMVRVVGETLRGEYPVNFKVRVLDDNDVLLSEINVINNHEFVRYIHIPENPTNATKLELEIYRWSKGGTNVKIMEFVDSPYIQVITMDEYFKKDTPIKYNSLVNHITLTTNPMTNTGETLDGEVITLRNEDSILENGLRKFEVSSPLIQTVEVGDEIARRILNEYSNPQNDISLEWRGNPSLLLGDLIEFEDDKDSYIVSRQELDFAGYLRSNLDGRKVIG